MRAVLLRRYVTPAAHTSWRSIGGRSDHIRDGKPRERLAIDSVQQRDGIGAFQHLRQRRDAGRRQIDDVGIIIDQPNPHGGVTGEKAANLHGGHASDCTRTGSRKGVAIVTGFRSARPKPAN